ncbi:MAG: NAD-glutamate dehydrogenase [Candidatus Competibacteraceae bacterium]
MTSKAEEKKALLIDRIITVLGERLPADVASLAQIFARQYFAWVSPEDLLDDEPEDLYGAVLAQWNFARRRQPREVLIRVYNPDFEVHGWRSTHSVVEIVNDDMPFLVDSVTMELNRHGLTVHRTIHPVMAVRRDSTGCLQEILPPGGEGGAEAFMHFEVDRQSDPAFLESLGQALRRVLDDVRVAVEDWRPMRSRMLEITATLDSAGLPPPVRSELDEIEAFLHWTTDGNFTFLGYRDYDLLDQNGELILRAVPGSGLGILRDDRADQVSRSFAMLPEQQRRLVYAPTLLILTKASARSTVHRPANLDYIGIKRFDEAGKVLGEQRFLGLYTSLAYSMRPQEIPLLRRKVERVLERASLSPVSHSGKVLRHVLDNFPRDDLFQISEEDLYDIAVGILHLQERQRLRLFVRADLFGRFVSCIVYVPLERYNTALRLRMQAILLRAFNGLSAEFSTQFSEAVLARVLFTIRTTPGQIPDYSVTELEQQLREALLSWEDELQQALLEECGEARGNALFQRYQQAFPVAYRDDFKPRIAVHDILRLETVGDDRPLVMHLYRIPEDPERLLRFKLFGRQHIALSAVLPMLEKLGLRVLQARPYEITPGADTLWILDFDMVEHQGVSVDVVQVKENFQDAFARIWNGAMESDGFNRLVLGAGLNWREVVVLRAYCKYLLQARAPFSQAYMEQALCKHPLLARYLAELFQARFDPRLQLDQGRRTTVLGVAIEEALEHVGILDEDRILRRFRNLIEATLRTNFFQTDSQGEPKEYLAFKFDPTRIEELPKPRPMFEVFVYSPRVEAVHLRGGPVARGGLRWSDRKEDFRTEVLGLMKAQMVKNAVIVPVGAKGGFVVKQPPTDRAALQQEGVYCYRTLIRGLLDLTDNRQGDTIVHPPRVVHYDGDDPYLVVAADKGTATFSDIANGIAAEYGFWLGDAFASGGSAGYDHKKMGITARGAWESVKRHFRELGKDIQNRDEITVLGIGDMAGDVFGNGMLQSRRIQLVAAFNHQHIFLDPNPAPEASYRERKRLFNLPGSTWDDYDKALLSSGGGIYSRAAKVIQVSPEARAVLDLKSESYTPNDLIHQLLKAPVDLLWNGGIGTYVKATTETHTEVGDKANDALRVDGRELRCKVVGEGGNLGFTQRGRIEYALIGGKILTDAIDNSGGVNCSDHEVNIKILLDQVVRNGDLTEKQRNQLLVDMTGEVAELVLRQNYLQPQAISLSSARAAELLGDYARLIRSLEKAGRLDRTLEALPSDEVLAEREAAHQGLTPPETAVLLAYSKIYLYQELLASDVPEDPYLKNELLAYFPRVMQERFNREMESHPLKREIIATHITNSLVNRMGAGFTFRVWEETGASYPDIARAYTAAREMFEGHRLWNAIELLDNQVPAVVQIAMLLHSRRLLERACLWLLRHRRPPLAVAMVIDQFSAGIAAIRNRLPDLLKAAEQAELQAACQRFGAAAVPAELAQWVAGMDALYCALDLVEVAGKTQLPVATVGAVYFDLVNRLELNWLRRNIVELATTSHWQNRARAALLQGLYDQGRLLTAAVLQATDNTLTPSVRLDAWMAQNQSGVERCRNRFAELRAAGKPDLAMLLVALRETADLARGSAG